MDATPNETWKPIVGWEDLYEVSDLGRVRSLPRLISFGNTEYIRRGQIRKPVSAAGCKGKRYLMVSLQCKAAGLKPINHYVHQLVAAAFIGPRPEGQFVRHLNDDQTDNRLTNLAYGTQLDNMGDMLTNTGHYLSNRTHCNKGHEFTVENTIWRSDVRRNGSRRCRTCQVAKDQAKYLRRKATKAV